MGSLTTHVLDTAHGCPARGVRVELWATPTRELRCADVTNDDGRCDKPLLTTANFIPGEYELIFHIGAYFRAKGVALTTPPFLDRVVLRVGLADATAHYHVPLLVSPWSYSTYRGS